MRLFAPEFSYQWFLPVGGPTGNLRPQEARYLALLIRHADIFSGSRFLVSRVRSVDWLPSRISLVEFTFSSPEISGRSGCR